MIQVLTPRYECPVPKASPRECALDVLLASYKGAGFVEGPLHERLDDPALSHKERAQITGLVCGVTRRRLTLDWLIERFSTRPLDRLTPELHVILRLGLCQILYLDAVPDYAAVSEAVDAARRRVHEGAARFANAVLRAVLRAKADLPWPPETGLVDHLAVVHSHPRWLVARWLKHLGREKTIEICTTNNSPSPLFVRANRLKLTRDELLAHFAQSGVEATPLDGDPSAARIEDPGPIDALETYQRGEFYVQDLTAMRVAPLLDPQPGETVLDLCAAPGGKTGHCAELMRDTGRIVACDVEGRRLDRLRENMARLGITCVEPARCDALHLPRLIPVGSFDRVLLDAPCSNTGVLRRRVDARWRLTEADLAAFGARQAELLDVAARMARPRAVLVYSTCSIEPEENAHVVRGFLSRHGEFRLESETAILPTLDGGDGGYTARLIAAA
ncbi:MAG: 16S rRNA (cytosine(967)-C(5))-methyltransferase RsmB [Verrucomicrobia bacterium]|nr:16S rRNA (cytosine(967)-C(5))-methyltransferase RsmB [Verrucomicrobiota bacterium]